MKKKDFKVAVIGEVQSEEGYSQMILVAKDGEAYRTTAKGEDVKNEGEIIIGSKGKGKGKNFIFERHEGTERVEDAPKEVVESMF
jgi:hypothetical protein